MNDPWAVAGKIVEAIDALSGNPELHGVSALRKEIARLKAINAKQGGEIAKKSAEISNLRGAKRKLSDDLDELREAQTRGGQAVELQRQHEEIRDLREDLHFKSIEIKGKDDKIEMLTEHLNRASAEIKELKASLEHKDKAAIQISRSNAALRSEIYDVKCARDTYRRDGIELRDVLAEIRRALDDYDNEED